MGMVVFCFSQNPNKIESITIVFIILITVSQAMSFRKKQSMTNTIRKSQVIWIGQTSVNDCSRKNTAHIHYENNSL